MRFLTILGGTSIGESVASNTTSVRNGTQDKQSRVALRAAPRRQITQDPRENSIKARYDDSKFLYCDQLRIDCSSFPSADSILFGVHNIDQSRFLAALDVVAKSIEIGIHENPLNTFISLPMISLKLAAGLVGLPQSLGDCPTKLMLSTLDQVAHGREDPEVVKIAREMEAYLKLLSSTVPSGDPFLEEVHKFIENSLILMKLNKIEKFELIQNLKLIWKYFPNSIPESSLISINFLTPMNTEMNALINAVCSTGSPEKLRKISEVFNRELTTRLIRSGPGIPGLQWSGPVRFPIASRFLADEAIGIRNWIPAHQQISNDDFSIPVGVLVEAIDRLSPNVREKISNLLIQTRPTDPAFPALTQAAKFAVRALQSDYTLTENGQVETGGGGMDLHKRRYAEGLVSRFLDGSRFDVEKLWDAKKLLDSARMDSAIYEINFQFFLNLFNLNKIGNDLKFIEIQNRFLDVIDRHDPELIRNILTDVIPSVNEAMEASLWLPVVPGRQAEEARIQKIIRDAEEKIPPVRTFLDKHPTIQCAVNFVSRIVESSVDYTKKMIFGSPKKK